MITGNSLTRLVELEKYNKDGDLANRYFIDGSETNDGIDFINSVENESIIYYIGGIKYIDFFDENSEYLRTEFNYIPQGTNTPDFVEFPVIKDFAKSNVISNPEINNNVFIIRQSLPVFQNIYRLDNITKLSDLNKYAGGAKFNIVNNSQ